MEALIGLILLLSMIAIPVTLVIFLITFFRKNLQRINGQSPVLLV